MHFVLTHICIEFFSLYIYFFCLVFSLFGILYYIKPDICYFCKVFCVMCVNNKKTFIIGFFYIQYRFFVHFFVRITILVFQKVSNDMVSTHHIQARRHRFYLKIEGRWSRLIPKIFFKKMYKLYTYNFNFTVNFLILTSIAPTKLGRGQLQ